MRLSRRDTSPARHKARPGTGTVPPPADTPPAEDPSGEAIPPVRDADGGPGSPLEIGRTGWLNTAKRTGKKYSKDRCSMAAGSLAYHWFLALFPALVALLGVVSLLHLDVNQVHKIVNGLNSALPAGARTVFDNAVSSATTRTSAKGSLITLIIGVVLALWSSSGGMVALETALDVAYEVPANAKFVKKRTKAFTLMLCTVVLGGIASVLIVEGAPLGKEISSLISFHGTGFNIVWDVVRWAITIILVSLLFSGYYYFGPNRESPKWQWVSPGGLVGTIIFLAASLGLSFYVSAFGSSSYSKTYGALAGVVLLLLWLYLAGTAILLGGEINAEVEREAAAQAGHPGAQASARTVEQSSASPSSNRASS
ncbi:MAG: YihY/virulence factor BrkB family protein [Streptosporangiaceae bacterium]